MEQIYRQTYLVENSDVDCFGRLMPSRILFYAQDAAGKHCGLLRVDHNTLSGRNLFWAVSRHRVQITRLPVSGEKVTVETWPMPATRVAYPRSTVAYDSEGRELFRSISLWVLMDLNTRAMILPGKSGVEVTGLLRGSELAAPGSLAPRVLANSRSRKVSFMDLDRNGHMNNCRYLDWVGDLLPSIFHRSHPIREFTLCYLSEALEEEMVEMTWELDEEGNLRVEGTREEAASSAGHSRVFSVQILF